MEARLRPLTRRLSRKGLLLCGEALRDLLRVYSSNSQCDRQRGIFALSKTFFRRNTDVFQGKMAQRSVKRPAVRVRWELEEYTLKTFRKWRKKKVRASPASEGDFSERFYRHDLPNAPEKRISSKFSQIPYRTIALCIEKCKRKMQKMLCFCVIFMEMHENKESAAAKMEAKGK